MNINELIKITANKMTSISENGFTEECPIGIININNWEWPQGVGLYGLYRYYKEKGEFKDYLINWYNGRISEGLPEKNVNTMAPMLTLAFLYEETRNEIYGNLCLEWAEWVMNEMPRTADGGIQHIVSGEENKGQLWDDTLFMTVLFLAKAGVIFNRKDYIDEAVYQFLVHIKYLYDKRTGLWFHGWSFIENNNFAEALWARGNCWITAGIPEFLDIASDIPPSVKRYLLNTLEAQISTLAELQNENGMWHTLLDDNTSYQETSATAGFGYGILKSVRLGYVDPKYSKMGKKALNAVIERISGDGTVNEVSYGTGMGRDLEHYKKIPLCPMTYGQALAIMILIEGLKSSDS